MFKEDNKKELLTKAGISERLIKREGVRLITMTIGTVCILIVGWLTLLFSPVIGIGVPIFAALCMLAFIAAYIDLAVTYTKLKKMSFDVVTDSVLIKDMGSVPYYKRPRRNDSRLVLGFYEHGWVYVSAKTYRYAEVDDEFFLVVLGNKKKSALMAYNKKFFDYKEK